MRQECGSRIWRSGLSGRCLFFGRGRSVRFQQARRLDPTATRWCLSATCALMSLLTVNDAPVVGAPTPLSLLSVCLTLSHTHTLSKERCCMAYTNCQVHAPGSENPGAIRTPATSSSSLLLSSLELSDTQVYEPEIRALLGTRSTTDRSSSDGADGKHTDMRIAPPSKNVEERMPGLSSGPGESCRVQGHLAHKKPPRPLAPP